MKLKKLALILALPILLVSLQAQRLPAVSLSGSAGSAADGSPWSSRALRGKVHLILYMDPSLRKKAMPFLKALDARRFDARAYSTVAIVNLADTWMPDAILESLLAKKSRELHATEFIFDRKKSLLKPWHLADHACNLILIDRKGRILYRRRGIPDPAQSERIFRLIRQSIKQGD
ncbi:YtfJ family protein [Nitratifractor sp.]